MLFSVDVSRSYLAIVSTIVQSYGLHRIFTHPPVVQERPMHWNLYLVTTIPLKGFPTGQGVDFVLGEGKTFPPNYPKNHQHPVSPCTYPMNVFVLLEYQFY